MTRLPPLLLSKTLAVAALTLCMTHTTAFASTFDDPTVDGFTEEFASEDVVENLKSLMKTYHNYDQFNGAVLVVRDGEVIFKKGYGYANMEWKVDNRTDTKFRIASLTKQFTSMLIMQLVQEGKIKLGGKITNYLPNYRQDTGKKVTIHHLLSHTAGIPNYTNLPNFFSEVAMGNYSADEFSKQFCSGDLEFAPGSKFAYSNSGYFLLGHIIEKVTGESFADVLKEKITEPLGMKNTGYAFNKPIIEKRANGYRRTPQGYANAHYINMSLVHSAGAIYSTVEDLAKWDKALYESELLSQKYKEKMFTANKRDYGYGWQVGMTTIGEDSINTVSHEGGINGFSSHINRMIDDKHMVVLLNNTNRADLRAISASITNILYDQPYVEPKRSIVTALREKLTEYGIPAAIRHYHELRKSHADEYSFTEQELNMLGYQMLGEGHVKEAIAMFELNTQTHSESGNTFDSLGEAYLADGKTKLAIKSYKKALALDSTNDNAQAQLKKMGAL